MKSVYDSGKSTQGHLFCNVGDLDYFKVIRQNIVYGKLKYVVKNCIVSNDINLRLSLPGCEEIN